MNCPITGVSCLGKKCKQYIPKNKAYHTHCKLEYIFEKALKFQDLADLIQEICLIFRR